ncbi:Sodium/hydrogen exchanger family [Popillia japonica]|uniref:Sodium/hydrogen exchanger family n=1 Tax=Popillia japonica TaxID=7064 RepID=A0AAW1N4H3_POPJA
MNGHNRYLNSLISTPLWSYKNLSPRTETDKTALPFCFRFPYGAEAQYRPELRPIKQLSHSVSGFHMAPKLSEIFPESCLLVVVGVVIGVVLVHVTDSSYMALLTPDTFFFYMLPPIILDAGYFMPNRLFFDHLGTILTFAVIGTIFNTLTIGK